MAAAYLSTPPSPPQTVGGHHCATPAPERNPQPNQACPAQRLAQAAQPVAHYLDPAQSYPRALPNLGSSIRVARAATAADVTAVCGHARNCLAQGLQPHRWRKPVAETQWIGHALLDRRPTSSCRAGQYPHRALRRSVAAYTAVFTATTRALRDPDAMASSVPD